VKTKEECNRQVGKCYPGKSESLCHVHSDPKGAELWLIVGNALKYCQTKNKTIELK